jgi:hypothetical protein
MCGRVAPSATVKFLSKTCSFWADPSPRCVYPTSHIKQRLCASFSRGPRLYSRPGHRLSWCGFCELPQSLQADSGVNVWEWSTTAFFLLQSILFIWCYMNATIEVVAKQTRNIGQLRLLMCRSEAIESSSHSDTYNGLKATVLKVITLVSCGPMACYLYCRWIVGPFKGALSGRDTVHVRAYIHVNQLKLVSINMSWEACPPKVLLCNPIAAVFEQYRKHASRALGFKKNCLSGRY